MGIHSSTARTHYPRVQLLIFRPLVSPTVVFSALIKSCSIVMSDQTKTYLCSGMQISNSLEISCNIQMASLLLDLP